MSFEASYPTTHHAYGARSDLFTDSRRLEDPQGTLFDLSDRPLVCLSTDHQREVVVAGTDHALYSIDLQNLQRKPTTMYSKTSGHTDWVSSVCHISTGAVLSGGTVDIIIIFNYYISIIVNCYLVDLMMCMGLGTCSYYAHISPICIFISNTNITRIIS